MDGLAVAPRDQRARRRRRVPASLLVSARPFVACNAAGRRRPDDRGAGRARIRPEAESRSAARMRRTSAEAATTTRQAAARRGPPKDRGTLRHARRPRCDRRDSARPAQSRTIGSARPAPNASPTSDARLGRRDEEGDSGKRPQREGVDERREAEAEQNAIHQRGDREWQRRGASAPAPGGGSAERSQAPNVSRSRRATPKTAMSTSPPAPAKLRQQRRACRTWPSPPAKAPSAKVSAAEPYAPAAARRSSRSSRSRTATRFR